MKPTVWIIAGSLAALLITIAAISLAVSCRNESEKPSFARVRLALSDPDPAVGLAELEHYLSRNPDSAQGHLLLANLYDERLNRPLDAIAEYRLYQKNSQNANAAEVDRWIAAARKRCYIEWSSEFADAGNSAVRQELLKLQNENRELRWQIGEFERLIAEPLPGAAATPAAAAPPPVENTPDAAVPTTAGSTDYEVRPGDTLQKIAKKLYGSSKFYLVIYECNKNVLKSPNALHAGQKLRLPTPEAIKAAGAGSSAAAAEKTPPVDTKLPPIPPLTTEQLKAIRPQNGKSAAREKDTAPAKVGYDAAEQKTPAAVTPYLY
ncbi:MAG: LysM peptidoglycan-binding domain-containing protein [Victivallaceae bacterium]|nr:LysM peptidoglycan-binding domain-containing protein [Victivallaceae bacterium]